MFASLFMKKTIFFLSTGTILFYLVSFSSMGQTPQDKSSQKDLLDCQENVREMNYARLQNLRRSAEVTHKNVLKLTTAEQRALSRFLKESQTGLVKHGNPSPVIITTNMYEAKNRKTLGYKIAIHSPEDKSKVATYFSGVEGNILFSHWSGFMSIKKWNCESTQYLK